MYVRPMAIIAALVCISFAGVRDAPATPRSFVNIAPIDDVIHVAQSSPTCAQCRAAAQRKCTYLHVNQRQLQACIASFMRNSRSCFQCS